MRAVVATRPGPADVLTVVELPDPEPEPPQVIVAVEAAATTFIDTQLRSGDGVRPLGADAFPIVLGNGVGGRVIAIGADVSPDWLSVRVVTSTGGSGGYASRAVAAFADLHRVPDDLDMATAVAVLADGRTALGLARAARIRRGETVVVTAAGGGVGSLLVQLASDAGGTVIALAGDGRKLDHARRQGATIAINYREAGWTDRLDPDLDVVFDGVGGDVSAPLATRIRAGGRYLPHGAASGGWGNVDTDDLRARGITMIPLTEIATDQAELYRLVEEALRRAADGTLRPTIGQTFPLERARDAHAAMEARETLGKTLLIP